MANFLNSLKNSLSLSLPQKLFDGEFFIYLHQYDIELNYQIKVSSRRKTLSLELKHGQVTIRAPHWLTMEDIESFIVSKQDWLMDKLQQQADRPQPCQYQDGEQILVFGQWLTLKIIPSRQYFLQLEPENDQLKMYVPSRVKDLKKYVKAKLKAFYLEQTADYLQQRFSQLEQQTGLKASALELKFFKSRWGCCYSSGLIKINPMLAGAPKWVIDCVVIHELCHLKHMNHSAQFWQLNQEFCSNCDASKQWLKAHSTALHLA